MQKTIGCVWIFRSESKPDQQYETLQYTDGTTSCNCPGWRFKRKNTPDGERSCKHVREIDLGTADRHAIAKKEYAVAATRTPQKAQTLPPEPAFNFQPNRLIEIED